MESAEIFPGSYETGQGSVLVTSRPGRNHIGLKHDKRSKLLFVAGGPSKGIYVYDSRNGADVRQYSFPNVGFINDVVVTKRAVYATDSQVQQCYKIALGRNGQPGAATTIPITGEFVYGPGFNANGIEAVRGGKKLIMVQSSTGKLFKVNSATGNSREIDLTGGVRDVIRNRSFDVPTTIAPYKRFICAVNGRFPPNGDNSTPREDVVRVSANGKKHRVKHPQPGYGARIDPGCA